MFKHANTFFPGDKVAEIKSDGTKVAGHSAGKVTGAVDGKFGVEWAPCHVDYHDPSELEKV